MGHSCWPTRRSGLDWSGHRGWAAAVQPSKLCCSGTGPFHSATSDFRADQYLSPAIHATLLRCGKTQVRMTSGYFGRVPANKKSRADPLASGRPW